MVKKLAEVHTSCASISANMLQSFLCQEFRSRAEREGRLAALTHVRPRHIQGEALHTLVSANVASCALSYQLRILAA